jgi:hypothetical protein
MWPQDFTAVGAEGPAVAAAPSSAMDRAKMLAAWSDSAKAASRGRDR